MDSRVERAIAAISSYDGLNQFEENAKRLGRLDNEMRAAIDAKTIELGRELVSKRTDIVVTELSPAEEKIIEAVAKYVGVKRRSGRDATRTFKQLQNRGLIESAETSVAKKKPTQGYKTLAAENLSDLSYEQIILQHPEEFTDRALWYARRTLGLENESTKPPARGSSPVQRRTEALVKWLEERARSHSGVIPPYTNAEAATAIGLGELQEYGRVQGNIQSRVDFACYLAGLPPLGLTATQQFTRAWRQEERSWPFPVERMSTAARERVWSQDDFERIVKEARKLPGQAHLSWRKALIETEGAVRAWAEGDFTPVEPARASWEGALERNDGKNPNWTREEHILALDLYLRLRGTSYSDQTPEIIALSKKLRMLGELRGVNGGKTFRNPAGVTMKMMNFRRVDPSYTAEGRVGLDRGSNLEVEVWNQFAHDRDALHEAVAGIDQSIAAANRAREGKFVESYWVFVCNPKRWAVDRFFAEGADRDTWGVRPSDAERFAPGQLGILRVGVDTRQATERNGAPPLEAGIYALCEVDSESFPGTGANDNYWADGAAREPGWPTVRIKYLRRYSDNPLTIARLRAEAPDLSRLLLNGFQAASFPISAEDFGVVMTLLNEDLEQMEARPGDGARTLDELAALEQRFANASPEVKSRVSKCVERGPIGAAVKRANGHKCQICEAMGLSPISFLKRSGDPYVEAHHVMPVHRGEVGTLSMSNIVTLCANHHRQMHFGNVEVMIGETEFTFKIDENEIKIPRAKIKPRVGILAYGSLITDPGTELIGVTIATIRNIETPFAIEYARSSTSRAGAPTLVPVESGGARVRAWIYEVDVEEAEAANILYRREIGKVGSTKIYTEPEPGDENKVGIDRFIGLGGLNVVLSTRLAATISPLTPQHLADLAIESARKLRNGRDGISYLLNATESGIATPLSGSYTLEICSRLGVHDLSQAVETTTLS